MTQDFKNDSRCGYVAIVGRPNVGKSTLLNRLLGKKLSITSRKPQTTRHRILGIKTVDSAQFVFVDTPGLHASHQRALNRLMNQTVYEVLQDVDVIVWLVDARGWRSQDDAVYQALQKLESNVPIIVVVNKIDRIKDRKQLLPLLQKIAAMHHFAHIIPLSAKTGEQVLLLEQQIAEYLPQSPHFFDSEQVTDRSSAFIIAERVREKLTRFLGEEIPYALTVTVELLEEQPAIIRAAAIIWVEKNSQKGIVIGQGGLVLKKVGQEARLDLEAYFGKKLFLELWVKVKSDWSDSEQLLQQLGYE